MTVKGFDMYFEDEKAQVKLWILALHTRVEQSQHDPVQAIRLSYIPNSGQ